MRTWDDYKEHASQASSVAKADIAEAETLAVIVSSLISRRNELGLSQRDLAELCGLPQSSIARFETMKTVPNIDTVLRIMRPLGLQLQVSAAQ